jgi:replicative DNA helicase
VSAPHSAEAEQALIARLILEPEQVALISGSLSPDDLYVQAYRDLYRTMIRLAGEGRPIDVVTLQDAGNEVDVLDLTAGHHAPLTQYVEIIQRKALDREVLTAVEKVQDAVAQGDPNIVVTLQRALSDVLHRTKGGVQVPVFRAIEEYMAKLAGRQAGEEPGLEWGVPGMDKLVNPATAGKFIIIAARPSVGKTAMAETIAENWAQQGRGVVLFCSLEMGIEELLDRAMARRSGVPARKIIRGKMNEEEMGKVEEAATWCKGLSLEYLDDPRTTVAGLQSAAARTKLSNDGALAAIIVDYIQLFSDEDRGDNPVWRMTKISRGLKALAREYRVPVLALSQFNRELDKRGGDPILSDLRESGALEQDADVVIALTGKPGSGMRHAHVLKQRQGESGMFMVRLDGSTMTWHAPGPWKQIYEDEPTYPVNEGLGADLEW